jgi:SNF2 family DNA or RNA helicase
LFDFLMKGHLGTYGRFTRQFETPITSGDDRAAQRLSRRIRPFVLRRLKEEVAKDLPEKIEMDEWCELTVEQASLYGQIQDRYAAPVRRALEGGEIVNYATSILPVLTKLKQVCDHPALITGDVEPVSGRSEKFDLVVEKVEEIHAGGEHVVLFSHFLDTLSLLEIALRQRGISYIRLDGSTTNRQKHIDRFNEHQAVAALCSIQACGHGITLTAANHVIHVDRWWNPAVEDQATDRVHRIGQDKTVYVHRILAEGTLEEKIALLLDKKRGISDRVIGAAVGREMKWTREELLELLKPMD